MRLFGWKQVYAPDVIAYHDRSTSKTIASARAHWWQYAPRAKERRQIALQKRQLDWLNVRFTIIKNDYIINVLRDLPQIVWRELKVLGYTLIFEPRVLAILPRFFKLLLRVIRTRIEIMKKVKASPREMRQWLK